MLMLLVVVDARSVCSDSELLSGEREFIQDFFLVPILVGAWVSVCDAMMDDGVRMNEWLELTFVGEVVNFFTVSVSIIMGKAVDVCWYCKFVKEMEMANAVPEYLKDYTPTILSELQMTCSLLNREKKKKKVSIRYKRARQPLLDLPTLSHAQIL
jgi:hypothetical protein